MDYINYIKEHTKLDLTDKFDSIEENKYHSGIQVLKFNIKQSEIDSVKSFINDNWKNGHNLKDVSVPKNFEMSIFKQLNEDVDYGKYYVFFWSPNSPAKTDSLDVYVVDKPNEMYIIFR